MSAHSFAFRGTFGTLILNRGGSVTMACPVCDHASGAVLDPGRSFTDHCRACGDPGHMALAEEVGEWADKLILGHEVMAS